MIYHVDNISYASQNDIIEPGGDIIDEKSYAWT